MPLRQAHFGNTDCVDALTAADATLSCADFDGTDCLWLWLWLWLQKKITIRKLKSRSRARAREARLSGGAREGRAREAHVRGSCALGTRAREARARGRARRRGARPGGARREAHTAGVDDCPPLRRHRLGDRQGCRHVRRRGDRHGRRRRNRRRDRSCDHAEAADSWGCWQQAKHAAKTRREWGVCCEEPDHWDAAADDDDDDDGVSDDGDYSP